MRTDTIAAIATAMSSSGIGIIRISGDEAVGIVDRIFSMKNGKNYLICRHIRFIMVISKMWMK